MSELTNTNRRRTQMQLLATVSAMALVACFASKAVAADTDRPTLWIELGGQAEMTQGTSAPFVAPFMTLSPSPDVYSTVPFIGSQKSPLFSIGAEGAITFQPEDSDWVFSAAARYRRSNSSRHFHNQNSRAPFPWHLTYGTHVYNYTKYFSTFRLADAQTQYRESHLVVDFMAGKDVGLGTFGREGSSTINAGIRFASFTSDVKATMTARPEINAVYHTKYGFRVPHATFYQYTLTARAARSFRGVGPSLSWNASADLLGNAQGSELSFDWGINAALLFGRQKANVVHTTLAHHQYPTQSHYGLAYSHPHDNTRSHTVTVPNLGGFAGLSVKYANAKVSFGYRGDFFFGAMDDGIDARRGKDVAFHGPFATISMGLGG